MVSEMLESVCNSVFIGILPSHNLVTEALTGEVNLTRLNIVHKFFHLK